MRCIRLRFPLLLGLWLVSSQVAADALEHVPGNALGLVLLNDLTQADAEIRRLFDLFRVPLPGPRELLRTVAKVDAGLDPHGPWLAMLLPGEASGKQTTTPRPCVFVPVSDYGQFLQSLGGDPTERISKVTLLGQKLLVARLDRWAILVDFDQRLFMEELLSGKVPPLATLATWKTWLGENDATVILLPPGVQAILHWTGGKDFVPHQAMQEGHFERAHEAAALPNSFLESVRQSIRQHLLETRELADWASQTEAIALGLRMEKSGHVTVRMRLRWQAESIFAQQASLGLEKTLPPALYADGEILLTGRGKIPHQARLALEPIMRRQLHRLQAYGNLDPGGKAIDRFYQAVAEAVEKVDSFSILAQPGDPQEAIYSNRFLAIRVPESAPFLKQAQEAMRLWNQMIDEAQTGDKENVQLFFDREEVKMGPWKGTEYTIDMAKAVGAQGLPEIRQTMERLFGSEGKYRMQMLQIDAQTVLLANASREQIKTLQKTYGHARKPHPRHDKMQIAQELLPKQADWRLFFSPHGHYRWLKRMKDVTHGKVLGGPIVPSFPNTPWIGMAGSIQEQEWSCEVVLPVETLRGLRSE